MKKILLFLLTFLACTYSAQAQDYIYIAGSGTGLLGWTEPSSANTSAYEPYKLAKVSDNVFEGTFTLNGSVYFRFYTALNGWSGTHCLGASSNNRDITGEFESNTFGITSNSQNVWLLKADGSEYVINVNLNTNKLAVSKKSSTPDPDPTYPKIWLRGAWTSDWKTEDAYEFKTTDGVTYTLTDVNGATVKGKQWQIANSDWSYKYGSSSKISAEGTYTLKSGNNQGFDSSFPDGTYDLEYNYNTYVLKVTKQGTTPDPDPTYPNIYLRGDFNSWGTGNMFVNNGDGTYSMTVADASTLSGQFKLASEDWSIEYTNGAKDGEKTIGIGETLSLYSNSDKKKSTFKSMSGAVTIDLKYIDNSSYVEVQMTISEQGTTPDPDPTYPNIYLRGDFNSWGTGNMFVNNGDGTYSMTVADASTLSGQFKLASEDWSIEYTNGAKDGEKTIGIGETLSLYSNSDKKKSTFKSMSGAVTIDLKYIDNSSYVEVQMTISEQGTTPDPTYPDLWLRGDFTSTKWGVDDKYKFTCTDGVYTLTVEAGKLSNCEFKIGSSETSGDWTIGFGGKDANVTAKIGEAFTVYDVAGDKNIYIEENSYKFDIKFVPDFANKTGELTISINNPSGIEDVEISNEAPVEYYNLQGVRVDGELNPGLYIRRQGNSASKVLIR